ncbi:adenylate/guanylate cyclase domain-containing protein [Stutzerimonas nosocomialis]|uniref:CHASE2 domain-containing protein n=1 Tax=Stutzerimonas nosocomialis TaxID=1056496 RepID=UPI00110950A3|nr:adenylate/guanylate cyclase domain-containing protein [Stutzerimonas nosocomialis]TLX61104.1 adenylate/guanylate cyclase domain-containing protein [Stutzerimonas nosocomialis]
MAFSGSISLGRLAAFGGLLAACLVYLYEPAVVQTLRNGLFDQYQRWQPRAAPAGTPAIQIVDIDEASLARLGQWPWPRTRMAELLDRLREAGAAVVVFDVLFAEPDRTSPARVATQPGIPEALSRQLAQLADHDQQLAVALARQPTVLGFAATAAAGADSPRKRFAVRSDDPQAVLAQVPGFGGSVGALPELQEVAAGNGAMTFVPDADGVVRRVPLLIRAGEELLPSLSAEALRVFLGQQVYRVALQPLGIERIDIGPQPIATNRRGELWVHYRPLPADQALPAWQVLDGRVDASTLKDSLVLVGSSAQGLQDLRFSPLGGIIPGVQVHAQALEQVLSGARLQRPVWSAAFEALGLLLGAILLCAVVMHTGALSGALLAIGLIAAFNLGAWWAFSAQGLLLDALTPSVGLLLCYFGASLARHRHSERQQRWIRDAFSHYVSPNLVEHLVRHPAQLQLGGRRQTCSFVFTDLTGFTRLMESQPPERVVSLLNEYLDGIIQIAFRHEGTLDRIVGDAVAILFSAPVVQPDHASRALACALEIRRFAGEHARRQQAAGIALGVTRIGVHSGEVVVGNFGGSTLFDYRALGDAVNVAARLESLNRHLGTSLCVSEPIRQANAQQPMRPVGDVVLMGKNEPVSLYEPLEAADEPYEKAYALLANCPAQAREAFEQLAMARPEDGLVAFQLGRLRRGEQGIRIAMERK